MKHFYFPEKLPRCAYPTASEGEQHGLQPLPPILMAIDWQAVEKYRSPKHQTAAISRLSNEQVLDIAQMVATAFSENEPMKKHLQPPRLMPENLKNAIHRDSFGAAIFGEWSPQNVVYWFIRLLILTNPSDAVGDIRTNTASCDLSLALLDDELGFVGAAFNAVLSNEMEEFRAGDPFLDAVLEADKPIVELIFEQEHEAVEALKEKYSSFREALEAEKVGLLFMVAKSRELPSECAFELVAASAAHFRQKGFQYMVTCASNQWTGAACEVLNGTRVHFSPYRTQQRVAESSAASPNEAHSEDGYISRKDSGAMFYVIKL